MKKIFVLVSLVVIFGFSHGVWAQGSNASADASSSILMGIDVASPHNTIVQNSETSPLQVPLPGQPSAPPIFINATDQRNILDILEFIREVPCPCREQLENLAKGSDASVNMTSQYEPLVSWSGRSSTDRICVDFERPQRMAAYLGPAVGKGGEKDTSIQNMADTLLKLMNMGATFAVFKARVIAEQVTSTHKGIAFGGGVSKLDTDFGWVASGVLGYAKHRGGKVALDGIQMTGYWTRYIIFDEEKERIQKKVDEMIAKGEKVKKMREEHEELRQTNEILKLKAENNRLLRELTAPVAKSGIREETIVPMEQKGAVATGIVR